MSTQKFDEHTNYYDWSFSDWPTDKCWDCGAVNYSNRGYRIIDDEIFYDCRKCANYHTANALRFSPVVGTEKQIAYVEKIRDKCRVKFARDLENYRTTENPSVTILAIINIAEYLIATSNPKPWIYFAERAASTLCQLKDDLISQDFNNKNLLENSEILKKKMEKF